MKSFNVRFESLDRKIKSRRLGIHYLGDKSKIHSKNQFWLVVFGKAKPGADENSWKFQIWIWDSYDERIIFEKKFENFIDCGDTLDYTDILDKEKVCIVWSHGYDPYVVDFNVDPVNVFRSGNSPAFYASRQRSVSQKYVSCKFSNLDRFGRVLFVYSPEKHLCLYLLDRHTETKGYYIRTDCNELIQCRQTLDSIFGISSNGIYLMYALSGALNQICVITLYYDKAKEIPFNGVERFRIPWYDPKGEVPTFDFHNSGFVIKQSFEGRTYSVEVPPCFFMSDD